MTEEEILKRLVGEFPFLQDKIRIQRKRRIFASVDEQNFEKVFVFAMRNLEFTILCTITGLDNGATLGFIYHMARIDGITLNIQIEVPKEDPVIQTMTKYFSCAEIYEREVMDLLGAKVEGLGEGERYPLPDSWPKDEYPLRKDWKSAMKSEEAPKDA
jgi:membrane-bound hydrogenase subunit beta